MTPTSSVRVPTSRVPTTVPTNVLCRASLPASSMYPMCTVPYRLTDNPFHAYIISLCSDRCIISTFSTLSVGSRGKLDCAGRGGPVSRGILLVSASFCVCFSGAAPAAGQWGALPHTPVGAHRPKPHSVRLYPRTYYCPPKIVAAKSTAPIVNGLLKVGTLPYLGTLPCFFWGGPPAGVTLGQRAQTATSRRKATESALTTTDRP